MNISKDLPKNIALGNYSYALKRVPAFQGGFRD